MKKELTAVQKEIAKLKTNCSNKKKNLAKERAKRGSKSKTEDSQKDEVGSKRLQQQAKQSNTSFPSNSTTEGIQNASDM